MARPKGSTKSVTSKHKTTTATETVAVVENKNDVTEMNDKETKVNKPIVKEPLRDTEEIAIESLIPNVSYKDDKTGDMYEWNEVGHVEYMTVETLKNMWRNWKGYFRNFWLKPNDERLINQFGLTNLYDKYEYLMDSDNYTKRNIDDICKTVSTVPNSLKTTICNFIKTMVIDGKLTDVHVIRMLENKLGLDLISLL